MSRALRAGAITGLSAVDAVAAHAGPRGFTDARWLAVAAAGGVAAIAALACALAVACNLHRRARWVSAGDLALPPGLGRAVDTPPFTLLIAVMLVCQGSAHAALLAGGVPNHTGVIAGPVVHVLLAVLGAAIIWFAGRMVWVAAASLAGAVAAALERLLAETSVLSRTPFAELFLPRARGGAIRGRAPPLPA